MMKTGTYQNFLEYLSYANLLRNLFEGLGSNTRSQTDMTTDEFVLNLNFIIIELFSSWDDTAKSSLCFINLKSILISLQHFPLLLLLEKLYVFIFNNWESHTSCTQKSQ
jgi:hypothetical protein